MKSILTKKQILEKFPGVDKVIDILNKSGIEWGVIAGTVVWLLTNWREVTDFDILIKDSDWNRVVRLFNRPKIKRDNAIGTVSHIHPDTNIELSSKGNFLRDGETYHIHINETVSKRIESFDMGGMDTKVLPVEDTIILKSILRRSQEEGKWDIEDIRALVKSGVEVDLKYLSKRLKETGASNVVVPVLSECGIQFRV